MGEVEYITMPLSIDTCLPIPEYIPMTFTTKKVASPKINKLSIIEP